LDWTFFFRCFDDALDVKIRVKLVYKVIEHVEDFLNASFFFAHIASHKKAFDASFYFLTALGREERLSVVLLLVAFFAPSIITLHLN